MAETVTYCARGCTRARAHLPHCADADCPGCEPRHARHGNLCDPCHHRLDMLLHDAPTIHAWLTIYLPGYGGAARNDAERRHATKAPPAPVNLGLLDLCDRWHTVITGWTDNLTDDQHLTGPPDRTVETCAKFLRTWLTTVESRPWAPDLFDELDDLTRDSHAAAPWRPEVRHAPGIPCPECHACALVVYGGQSDVTCAECRLVIPEARYGIWTRMLAEEARQESA